MANVGAGVGAAAAARASAEQISESEKVSQDIAEFRKRGGVESARARSGDSGEAEAIILAPLLGIAQYAIGLGGFLELLFGFFMILGILVRMPLQRELAVGFLDLLWSGRARHAQHIVVIALLVGHVAPARHRDSGKGLMSPAVWPRVPWLGARGGSCRRTRAASHLPRIDPGHPRSRRWRWLHARRDRRAFPWPRWAPSPAAAAYPGTGDR